ncbi:MAG: LysR family transcriptional regulator [Proteobacteria bacterium]|nr:LysR family transcriptional regulator [Pseudomonadota bacterium]
MKIGYRVWLDHNGKAFGKGPNELLKLVGATHSLRQAAARMGMSYSKAWKVIHAVEDRFGFPLMERTVGGRDGGGSRLTPRAKELLNQYDILEKDVQQAMEEIYRCRFGTWWEKETKKRPPQPL